jgi:hypothetical protein
MTSQINNRPDGGFEYVIGGTYPATDAERVDAMAQTLRVILKDIQNPGHDTDTRFGPTAQILMMTLRDCGLAFDWTDLEQERREAAARDSTRNAIDWLETVPEEKR